MARVTATAAARSFSVRSPSKWPGDDPEDEDYSYSDFSSDCSSDEMSMASGDDVILRGDYVANMTVGVWGDRATGDDGNTGDYDAAGDQTTGDDGANASVAGGDAGPAGDDEANAEPAGDDEANAEPAGDDEANDEPAGDDEANAEPAGDDEANGPGEEDISRIPLTDEQVAMLQERIYEYRHAHSAARPAIVQECIEEVKRTWAGGVDFNRELIEKLVCRYLGGKPGKRRKAHIFSKKWTYNDILVHFHRDELDKMATEMSNDKAGSVAYLRCYKKALKILEEKLDDDTRVKYRAEAKKWTEHQPPARQQMRMFAKHGQNVLRDFSETMFHKFGVRLAILAGYRDAEGDPAITLYNNENLGLDSFKERNKLWHQDPLVDDFSKWTAESFGLHPCDGSQENKLKTPNIVLQLDAHGYPKLPSWEAIKPKTLEYKKVFIGKYMTMMYQIALGGGKKRIPWTKLKNVPGDFILSKYLPRGVNLTQYHHLRLQDADELLKHWIHRHACGEVPFRFKKPEVERADAASVPGESGANNTGNHSSPQPDANANRRRRGQVAETSGELPAEEDRAQHPPGHPTPHTGPRARPLTNASKTNQVAGASTGLVSHASGSTSRSPEGHLRKDQVAAKKGQELPRKRKGATDAIPHKRQKTGGHPETVQQSEAPSRRSSRTTRPTERAKEASGKTNTGKRGRR